MYVVVATKEVVGGVTDYVQRLHAINLSNGTDAVAPYSIGITNSSQPSYENPNTNTTQIYVYGDGDGSDGQEQLLATATLNFAVINGATPTLPDDWTGA